MVGWDALPHGLLDEVELCVFILDDFEHRVPLGSAVDCHLALLWSHRRTDGIYVERGERVEGGLGLLPQGGRHGRLGSALVHLHPVGL